MYRNKKLNIINSINRFIMLDALISLEGFTRSVSLKDLKDILPRHCFVLVWILCFSLEASFVSTPSIPKLVPYCDANFAFSIYFIQCVYKRRWWWSAVKSKQLYFQINLQKRNLELRYNQSFIMAINNFFFTFQILIHQIYI